MEKYQVLQGKFTKGGVGDYHLLKEFKHIKEAQEYFDEVKYDTRGWAIGKTEHMQTILMSPADVLDYHQCDKDGYAI